MSSFFPLYSLLFIFMFMFSFSFFSFVSFVGVGPSFSRLVFGPSFSWLGSPGVKPPYLLSVKVRHFLQGREVGPSWGWWGGNALLWWAVASPSRGLVLARLSCGGGCLFLPASPFGLSSGVWGYGPSWSGRLALSSCGGGWACLVVVGGDLSFSG